MSVSVLPGFSAMVAHGSPTVASRFGMVSTVKSNGFAFSSSSHSSGVDTVAVGSGRGLYAPAIVRSRLAWLKSAKIFSPRSSFHHDVVKGATERSRFSANKDVSFVRLRPERVIEVRYDQMEGSRFRHSVQFDRWRPDRDARSCTFEQLEKPLAYDLADVLA